MTVPERRDTFPLDDLSEAAELHPTGLHYTRDLSFDEWSRHLSRLTKAGEAVQWWIGDSLQYGEQQWGEKYAQAVEAGKVLGLSADTVRKYQFVAEQVGFDLRRTNLSYTHHEAVAGLDPPEQERLLEAAEERGWSVRDTREAVQTYKRERERQQNEDAAPDTLAVEDLDALAGYRFGAVYADPPWSYGNQGTRGATSDHYGTMDVEDICALPVTDMVADNAHLHLWTTNAFLFDARKVIEAWGFDYKSCFVWVKPQMGMGNYWRVSHEFCLLGVRGSTPFRERDEMSWREWPRGQHSAKPGQMHRLIQRVSPGPYLELFARQPRDGWVTWGNEIERDLFYRAVG